MVREKLDYFVFGEAFIAFYIFLRLHLLKSEIILPAKLSLNYTLITAQLKQDHVFWRGITGFLLEKIIWYDRMHGQ